MNLYVWCLTIFAAFGGFMFGYDIGVINGVKDMKSFRETFHIAHGMGNHTSSCSESESVEDSTLLGLVVSVFSLGCLAGALVAGVLSDVLGRKRAIMIGGLVFAIGGAFQAASYYLWMLLIGRIIAGIGVGILSTVVPVYNAELAPKNLRGRLVSLNQLAITAGIMVSFIVDLVCEKFTVGWRVALGVQCVFGVVLILGTMLLPETPRWLVKRHKNEEASRVLAKLRRLDVEGIQEELSEIQLSIGGEAGGQQTGAAGVLLMWKALLSWKKRVLLGMVLQLFQQFTGMNVIMYYSTSIFCKIGVASYTSTAVVGTLNFLTTILSIFLVDKVGRKALLLMSALGMAVSMATAATLILVFRVEEGANKAVGYIVVLLVCSFVFNFAYGWGPVAWVITSEIFPLSVRGIAVSLTTAANWSGNFVIAMVTPILLASALQTAGTFYILFVFLVAALVFVLVTLPETKGESLEQVEELFSKPWLERVNMLYYLKCGCLWCWRKEHSTQYRPSQLMQSDEDRSDDRILLLGNEGQSASPNEEGESTCSWTEDT